MLVYVTKEVFCVWCLKREGGGRDGDREREGAVERKTEREGEGKRETC